MVTCAVARTGLGGGGIREIDTLLDLGVQVNVVLAFFNLLPIPPLDGSRVVEGLLPARLRPVWDRIAGLGPIVLGGLGLAAWFFWSALRG